MPIKLASGQTIADTDPNFAEYKNTAGATIIENPPAPSAPAQTIADAYGTLNFETPEERAFREQQGANDLAGANTVIDENAIRTNTLNQFQAEIDALNRVYAEKKRVEQIAGQGRMGNVAAIGARRGLLGSDFGVAMENNQETANTQAINAIDDERLLKHSAILSEARNLATKEIENKTEAKRLGAENYLKYISESSTRRENNAKEISKKIYDQGIENPDFNSIAKELKISVEALTNTYNTYKKEQDDTVAKATQEKADKVAAENIKRQESLLKDGYSYVKTPEELTALKSKGYDVTEIDGRTYAKKPNYKTQTVKDGNSNYLITTDEKGNIVNRVRVGSAGGGNTSSSDDAQKVINKELETLSSEDGNWANSYNKLAQMYPDYDKVIKDEDKEAYKEAGIIFKNGDETILDVLLGKSRFYTKGGEYVEEEQD